MMCRFLLLAIISSLFLARPDAAQAQAFGDLPGSINFAGQSPELKDVLTLQYQIQVLRRLIEHEKAVNEIVTSSISLGIADPAIPAPSETLCSEVPANIPCAKSYDDLYADYSVSPKKLVPIDVAPPAPSIVANSDIPSLAASALPDLPGALLSGAPLYWTDITCLAGKCSAVISPNPADARARYRVVTGEKLPDGSVIHAISAAGVSILRDKKTVALDPAPRAS